MHILLIGHSAIVKKRVLPALRSIKQVGRIDIASRSTPACCGDTPICNGSFYSDYAEAISKSGADVVYISLVNSSHAEWVEHALEKGLHVIVDKPACTSLEDARRLTDLACANGLCLAEATVYAWHPQIQLARDLFAAAAGHPTRLTAAFSFPPFPPDNFRNQKQLGGGALWDLGPYAVSSGRLFFNDAPDKMYCRVSTTNPETGVDTAFSLLATYPGGRSLVGHFDFNTEYRNHINILGPGMSIDIDRVFTTTPDMENMLMVRSQNQPKSIKAPAADSFALFLQDVFDAIKKNSYSSFAENLLSDATALNRLQNAAQEE